MHYICRIVVFLTFTMKKIIRIVLILISLPYWGQGQDMVLEGRVFSEEGELLDGAVVELVGTKVVAQTNSEGSYQLVVPKAGKYDIQYSYLGFDKLLVEGVLLTQKAQKLADVYLTTSSWNKDQIILVTEQKEAIIGTKSEVNQAFFEQNIAGTFSKSIEKIAGVNAINVGVGIAKPVIRGLSFNRIVVNNDGVKQEGQQWGADHGLEIDQFGVDRVEIVKGAASLQYGSDALGGAINILPTKIPAKNSLQASILGLYKSNNQHGGLSAYLGGRWNDYFADFRLSYQDFADYRVPTDSFVYNSYVLPIYNHQLKNTAGKERNIKATIGMAKKWGVSRLTFSQYYLQVGIFSGAVGIPRAYALEVDGDDRDHDFPSQEVSHIRVVWNNDLYIKKHRLQINIAYQNNDRKEFSFPHKHKLPPVDSSGIALRLTLQTISANFILTQELNTKWKFTYGLSAQYQHNQRSGFEFLLPNFQTIRSGLYGIGYFKPNKRNLFMGGVRLDYAYNQNDAYEQAVYGNNQEIEYIPKTEGSEKHFFNYAASLGWRCQLKPEVLDLSIHFGKSYRVPYPAETSSNGIHHGTFRHEMGRSDLESEHGYQLEVATNWQWKYLTVNGALFGNYFQDYIYLSPTGKFSPLPEAGQLYAYRQTNAVYWGGELSWEWEPIHGLFMKQAYEYVWNTNLSTNLSLPFTPPASILTEVEYHHHQWSFLEDLYGQITYRYSFAQKRTDRNERATPAYHLLGLGVGFKIRVGKQRIDLGCQVQNLLNTPYFNHLSRYRILDIPEQGRNIVVRVKIPLSFTFKET